MAGRPPIDVTRVVQELVQLAEAAGLRDDPAVQRRIRAVAATRDVRLAETMRRALLPRATERVLGGNPFPPTVDENLHSGVKPDRSVLVGVVQDVLHAAPFFFDVDSL